MSKSVSVLQGKVAEGDVTVADAGPRGMITLRGDLSNSKLQTVCKSLTGADFPSQGQATGKGDKGLAWMSPDEVLVMVPFDKVDGALKKIATALKAQHHLAVDVSDARAVMTVKGAFAREVISKLAPVDLHPSAFRVGRFRRTRLGQVAAAFWLREEAHFEVICFRSVGEYTFDLLVASAKAGPVGHLNG